MVATVVGRTQLVRLAIKTVFWLLVVGVCVYLVHPGRFACENYPNIRRNQIESNLVQYQDGPNLCNFSVSKEEDFLLYPSWPEEGDLEAVENGQWSPKNCKARHETTIIIPYRNRQEHLETFLNFMHAFLQRQMLDYHIVVVEQVANTPFNRAKLFNVGFAESVKANRQSTCFVFHDVDLLPQKLSNIYTCTKNPRHMSASVNTFRYNLPYVSLFGGAISVTKDQFESVNGFSNVFYGWGGEDDDFYNRITRQGLKVDRFESSVAMYFMLSHKKEAPSQSRLQKLHSGSDRFQTDGLNSLKYELKQTTFRKLYTWYLVDV
ncbi:beta-1,4-N-acetylgalactosaminyltransferase bre-4-like [Neocloeon triangulifer]|uniref:beta-1,4-N-acetylgalactosaminyltransferase bre-4-like n=1 Tax=Neocloeon triangulifer TaxID=2078957 RepID=UPI00286F264D|nr:beta-1,4-N-acetylgalactosaminyltransferase bre-4-like [Neocloeon triangulifer]XP_059490756.1 beta-1,4-N-acetylgalactosaminyltransferase bre-4-like [Neocloeon triangulifer]